MPRFMLHIAVPDWYVAIQNNIPDWYVVSKYTSYEYFVSFSGFFVTGNKFSDVRRRRRKIG